MTKTKGKTPDYVGEYIADIESGKILTGHLIREWYVNHIKPIVQDKDPKWKYVPKKGYKYIRFVEHFCKQSKGQWAGQPIKFMLFQKAKWQAVFSIVSRETGLRRFQEIFDERGRKNGKTTELAPLADYLILQESGAEFYSCATTRNQAMRVWQEALSIIDQSEDLSEYIGHKVFPQPEIYTKKNYSEIKSSFYVLANKPKNLDGLNASGAIIDEIHELPRQIYDIIKQSMTARKEPLLSLIGSAGFVRGALFDSERDYAVKVIEKVAEDERLFPLLYELDSPDEWLDETKWIKANPGLDVIKDRSKLRDNVNRAKVDVNFAISVKTKDFNIINVAKSSWLTYDEIINADFGMYSEDEIGEWGSEKRKQFMERFRNSVAIGGYDLSKTGDMTAFTTMLFDKEKKQIVCLNMYWVTRDFITSEQAVRAKVPFDAWIDRGLVRISGDSEIDYHDVAKYVYSMFEEYGINYDFICYDSWSATYLTTELEQYGYSREGCQVPVRQGFQSLSIPMQKFESLLKTKRLTHLKNPVTKWCLSNVELVMDRNGNMMPKKVNDDPAMKIDGFATILNCLYAFTKNPTSYIDFGAEDATEKEDS